MKSLKLIYMNNSVYFGVDDKKTGGGKYGDG
jgi:hypothetical protein